MSLPQSVTPGTGNSEHLTSQHNYTVHVLRGIALLGFLIISIWEFGGFNFNQRLFYQTGTHGGNYKLFASVSILFEGKMNALLAMVFGIALIVYARKKNLSSPISAADAYIRRMMWLMFFGVVNAFILLWPNDLLFPFGIVGVLLFAFTRLNTRAFFIAALVCTLVYCGKQYWNFADDRRDHRKYAAVISVEKKFQQDSTARAKKDSIDRKKDSVLFRDTILNNKRLDSIAKKNDTLSSKQAGEKAKWEGTIASLKFDSSAVEKENKTFRAKWDKVAYALMQRSQTRESFWLYRIGIWEIASMVFLGMALWNIGFFNSRFKPAHYFILGILGLVAGTLLGWYRIHFDVIRLSDYADFVQRRTFPHNQFFPFERLFMVIGYAAIIIWLLRTRFFASLSRGFAAVGRMALSNYILQTLICTLFFYGYGFSYFGRFTQWELYFVAVEITLVQIVFSVLWLRYYTIGPLEWLWECLVFRKKLPLQKRYQTHPVNSNN